MANLNQIKKLKDGLALVAGLFQKNLLKHSENKANLRKYYAK